MTNAAFIQEVVDLTNHYRAQNSLGPLSIDLKLVEVAQSYSEAMAYQDFFSHTGLDGSQPWDRTKAAGYESSFVGENLAAGYTSPQAVVNGWINSEGHRANLLNSSYNEIGIGYFYLENDTGNVNYKAYWTQLFGKGEIEATTSSPIQAISGSTSPTFDALKYAASNPDIIQAFGYNLSAWTQHYNTHGKAEGRQTNLFDAARYVASNTDLLAAFGYGLQVATEHYVKHGFFEGRSTDSFKPAQYLASHDDLIGGLGYNPEAATQHYIQWGYAEKRSQDSFDEMRYLASNQDLIQYFGSDLAAATQHYIQYGMVENRSKDSFDPTAYLEANADLQAAFGSNLAAATQHYVQFGYFEGRL